VGQPVPDFTKEGLLPPGDYKATFGELRESILVEGPGPESVWSEEWDAEWREHLTRQAETMCTQLWQVGIEDIYLDGSFTEAKAHPNDIDGYFECDARRVATGELQRKLNQIDPKKCWTWDPEERRAYRGYAKKQLPMWHAYRIELYPHYDQFTGITDEYGNPLTFPAAFRKRRRDDEPKGIVKVMPEE
jgi:hypothetical protein